MRRACYVVLLLMLSGLPLWASAQIAVGSPVAYVALGGVIQGLENCGQQYPEYRKALEKLLNEVDTLAPEMLGKIDRKKLEGHDTSSPSKPISTEECATLAQKPWAKTIANQYLDDQAEAVNGRESEAAWLRWLNAPNHSVPCLGIELSNPERTAWDLDARPLVTIQKVDPNSPASAVRLLPGDAILRLDDRRIDRRSDIDVIVLQAHPSDKLSMLVTRAGVAMIFEIQLGSRQLTGMTDHVCEPEVPAVAAPQR